MFPGHNAADPRASPAVAASSAAPGAHKDPRLRNRQMPVPMPEALVTPPPSIAAPPTFNPYSDLPAPQFQNFSSPVPAFRPTLPPFFPPQSPAQSPAPNYPLVPHGVLPPSTPSQMSPEAPTTPKLTPAKQTYGDFKRARAARQTSFDDVKQNVPQSNSYQLQSPQNNFDQQRNSQDMQAPDLRLNPYAAWVGAPVVRAPAVPLPNPDQLAHLVQFPPPSPFYKERIPEKPVVPDIRGNTGNNYPAWTMGQQRQSDSAERPRTERNRPGGYFRTDERRGYENEDDRNERRNSRDRRRNDDNNHRSYNGKSLTEQDNQRRDRDDRDYRKSRSESDRKPYRDRERYGDRNYRDRNRLPDRHDNKGRSERGDSDSYTIKQEPKPEEKEKSDPPIVKPAPPVLSSVPVRRDIGGFFVRAIPTELMEEDKKTANPKRSSSRERRSRSRDRRRSRSREKHRSRSRDRRRSRSRSRGRSRSRSRDRRRSRSRDRSYRRNRSSRRSRSRGRGRRSRSRRRSRSHGRSRRDRRSKSASPRSDSTTMSAFRRELAQQTNSRNERREELIEKWRRLNCKTDEELERKLIKLTKMGAEELLEQDKGYWIRSAPATTYYERDTTAVGLMRGTEKLSQLCVEFHKQLIESARKLRQERANCLPRLPNTRFCPCHANHDDDKSSCSSGSDDEDSMVMEELQRKMNHPFRLHKELWYNEPGEMNDGPLCKCSMKAKRSGIRHGIYAGEVPGVGLVSSVVQTSPFTLAEGIASVIGSDRSKNNKLKMLEDVPSEKKADDEKTDDALKAVAVAHNSCVTSYCCDLDSNNAGKLYHYRITISPPTNFMSQTPTIISHDGHEFIFTGFSMLSHYPLPKLPVCKVIRFNIEYRILYAEESYPENFTIRECNLFFDYLFTEILELIDLDLGAKEDKCPVFHFMPRFVRELHPEGHELLPMSVVMKYLLQSYRPLVPKDLLPDIPLTTNALWLKFADEAKGMVVTKPGMKPSSIRVDQLDKDVTKEEASATSPKKQTTSTTSSEADGKESEKDPTENDRKCNGEIDFEKKADEVGDAKEPEAGGEVSVPESNSQTEVYPVIVHFGLRPPQLSYAGNADYQQAWRKYVKYRHLIANLAKPTQEERAKLAAKEAELLKMRSKVNMKRDVTTTVSSEGFFRTGIMCDVVQHAMMIPVLSTHLRFHRSLDVLEKRIGYTFKNRSLLQLALTHPSYRENFGTNPDHARNSLQNCGIRHPTYGDRRIHYMSTKKRGINTLMAIMSRFGSKGEEESSISHYERLEFLGDAVVEFVSTIHLFHMFRDLEEGGLATYRAALVQNQHLAMLAKVLSLDSYLLYAHGSDLCHDVELSHALANCFESLMGALYLDGGIDVADRVFSNTVFGYDKDLLDVWVNYPPHILQEQEPNGDRQWIEKIDFLQNLAKFEESIGVTFRHIRILARAFTDRSVGYTNLTLGSNQRLEFLGDSVLQLTASNYLYKHFPDHHEGHLSLLRSSLVNNNTQSVVCDDLGMTTYARYASTKGDLKVKDRADLLEAFLGALYIDTGSFEFVEHFCNVCFFPRLQTFIMNQEWNDPKSKLQQCCLTLRTMDGAEPDIPSYKVVECKGPTNTRTYSVAVYFRGQRLATASGHSIQQAEMHAAEAAMENCLALFPQLNGSSKQHEKHSRRNSRNSDKQTRQFERTGTPERYKIRRSSSSPSKSSRSRRRSRSGSRRRSRSRSRKRSSSRTRNRSRSGSRKRSRSRSRSSSQKISKRRRSHSQSRKRSRSLSKEDGRGRAQSRSRDKSEERQKRASVSPPRTVRSEASVERKLEQEDVPLSPQSPTLSLFTSADLARIKARREVQSSHVNPMQTVEDIPSSVEVVNEVNSKECTHEARVVPQDSNVQAQASGEGVSHCGDIAVSQVSGRTQESIESMENETQAVHQCEEDSFLGKCEELESIRNDSSATENENITPDTFSIDSKIGSSRVDASEGSQAERFVPPPTLTNEATIDDFVQEHSGF